MPLPLRCVAVLALAAGLSACTSTPTASTPTPAPPATAVPSTMPSVEARPPEPAETPTRQRTPSSEDGRSSANPLAGRVVVLDAGHNGGNAADPARAAAPVEAGGFRKPCNTTGAATDSGYPEHAFTFDVVTRAAALLRARGAKVVLTRDSDSGFGPCVDRRASIANAAHADATVSVHADGAPSSGRGFHVITPALAPDGGNRSILRPSAELALAVRAAFRSDTGEPYATYLGGGDGLMQRSDLAGLNLARVPAVFVECANMRNPADAADLTAKVWRRRVAQAVADGIATYLAQRP